MSKAVRRGLRTLLQLIAAGGMTGLVAAVSEGLSAYTSGIVLAASTVLVAFTQNLLEDTGAVPTLLPDRQNPA